MDSNFFKQLFTSLNSEDSWTILGMLLVSFLIGLITNYLMNRRRVRDLESTLEKRGREIDQLKIQFESLQEQYSLQGADLKKANLELADKSKTLEIAEAEKRTVTSRLNSTLVDLDKSKEEFLENMSRLEDLNDQILGLRTKNSQLSAELEQNATINTQYSLSGGVAPVNKETEQKLANLMAENSLLKESIDELRVSGIPDGTTAAAIRLTELEDENLRLKNSIGDSTTITSSNEYIALTQQLLDLKSENEQLKMSISNTSETPVIDHDYATLQSRLAELESENDRLEESLAEITQLEEGNEALNTAVRNLMEENEELKDRVADLPQLESGNEILNNSMNTLISENEDLQNHAATVIQYESGNEVLTTTITELISENDTLKEQLNNKSNTQLEWAVGNGQNVEEIEEITTEEAKAKFRTAIGTQVAMASIEEKDDLKQINGIGPFIEEKLNDLGIYTFEQVSQLDEDLIETLTAAIEFFPGRIERDDWVGQADRLYYTKGTTPQEMTSSSKIITSRYATATEKIITQPAAIPTPNAIVTARIRTELDDLKKIEGIGPKIAEILNKGGILTFAGLAATPVDRLNRMLAEAGNRYKMHDPGTWPQQAKLAADGEWAKLKELQDYLDGGRDVAKG